jgi:hypothetical protein
VNWEAIIAAAGLLLAAAAQLSRLGQRTRLRKRLHQALELLPMLPKDGYGELRSALTAVVDGTSARLAEKERRWVERMSTRTERWRAVLTYGGLGVVVLGVILYSAPFAAGDITWGDWVPWSVCFVVMVSGVVYWIKYGDELLKAWRNSANTHPDPEAKGSPGQPVSQSGESQTAAATEVDRRSSG